MVDLGPPQTPRLVVKALVTGAIPAELSAILAAHYQIVCEDGMARTPEERSVQVIHSFLAQLVSGMDLVPSLDRVTMVRLYLDGKVLLLYSIFSIWVNIFYTQRRLFTYLGELPSDPPPLVVDIPSKTFTSRSFVRAVLQVNHATHLGGISPLNWQTKPCKRAVKSAGMEYVDLDSSEVGGRTPQRFRGVNRYVTPANRSRASLQGGS